MTGQTAAPSKPRVVHGDVSQIAGGPKLNSVLWLVVLAAGGVDIITFYQVLVLVLNVDEWMVWVSVVGFAVVALTLAHYAGLQARQAANPRNITGSVTAGWLFAGIWLALGVTAFVVRYVISLPSSAGMSTFVVDGTSSATIADSADATSQQLSALLFLVLYIATGTVAALHGFFRPEPAIKQYRRALGRRSEVARRHAHTSARAEFARQTLTSIERARQRREQALRQSQDEGRVVAERLRQEAVMHLSALRGQRGAVARHGRHYQTGNVIGRADAPSVATEDFPYATGLRHEPTQELPPATEGQSNDQL
jgi:uncharacterized membrane protein YecN with MAPEG domain